MTTDFWFTELLELFSIVPWLLFFSVEFVFIVQRILREISISLILLYFAELMNSYKITLKYHRWTPYRWLSHSTINLTINIFFLNSFCTPHIGTYLQQHLAKGNLTKINQAKQTISICKIVRKLSLLGSWLVSRGSFLMGRWLVFLVEVVIYGQVVSINWGSRLLRVGD